ncbi:MAG: cytochrome c-type biogenesis protein CcmH [Granulosicoccus sp.]
MNWLIAKCLFVLFILSVSMAPKAAEEMVTFDDPAQGKLYYSLLEEYRCLKCQNQNLAGSNASLAGDLRREIRDQILAGKTKNDIDEYLVARYGEFVLYRPRFSAKTAVLWIAPFVILLIAITSLVAMVKRRSGASIPVANEGLVPEEHGSESQIPSPSLSEDEKTKLDRARQLLK